MTDFLSRLVDKVLGHAPVAQPLIAPHYAQGAEIFGPDTTPFAVTETESYGYGDETVSSAVSPVAPDEKPASGLKRELAESYSTEKKELRGSSEDAAREAEIRRQPARVRSTSTPRTDTEETLMFSPQPDRAAISPPVVSPATEQNTRQSPRIESSRSEKEVKGEASQLIERPGEVRPADEMRKDMHQSAKEQTPVTTTKNSTGLDNRPIEKQASAALNTASDVRQIERQSPEPRPDARIAKQRTGDGQRTPAQASASVSAEGVNPVPALPVEYGSSAERIVRPERITARGRAEDKRTGAQSPPTIKVTIGRIEVRAVLPPVPRAQETALPRPTMSLDDYLKSVSGERR